MRDPANRPWQQLQHLADAGDTAGLDQLLAELSPGETGRALSRLDEAERSRLLTTLPADAAASLIEQISDAQAANLMEDLAPAEAAAIFHELRSADQADILTALEEVDAEALLAELDPEEAGLVRALATYAPDVAGGLMVTEYLVYPREARVSEVVGDLRANAEAYADFQIQYLYVTDEDRRLIGVLRLRDLVLRPEHARLEALMIPDPVAVDDHTPVAKLRGYFDRQHFLGLPVVDADGRLVGVIRRADVAEGLAEQTESDYRKALGIVGGEELRTMPVLSRSRRRLSWLSVNIVLNVLAASIIAFHQDTVAAVIALAAFLPIISDMSGCSGNQAVAVSIRELSLGLVRPVDVMRVWRKELSVGAINGLVLGVLVGLIAFLWQGNIVLGLVVGAALALNTVVSVSIGGAVPLILRRFNMDPALASGPILTTVTDMCGFLLTLTFAASLLPHLT